MDSGERLNGIQEVSGSIPLISTKVEIVHVEAWAVSFFMQTDEVGKLGFIRYSNYRICSIN